MAIDELELWQKVGVICTNNLMVLEAINDHIAEYK